MQTKFHKYKKQKGFTLIELMVVISIITFIASITLVNLDNAERKARDVRRIADMHQLQTALDLYYDDHGVYPTGDTDTACGGWDTSTADPFLSALVTSGVTNEVPVDPLNLGTGCGTYAYRYFRYPAGYQNCDASHGAFYVLGINAFESTTPVATSPGWSCPLRNWSAEFKWVTGKFER